MSILSQLRPKKGSTGYRKRVGRGDGSGLGGTSGKGHKGQKARTGGRVRWGFEGGQTPLSRRAPKFGFNNKDFRSEFEVVNLSTLSKFSGEVTPATLKQAGLITGRLPVKVLAKGEIKAALTVKADKFSKAAQAAIEKAGGKIELLGAK